MEPFWKEIGAFWNVREDILQIWSLEFAFFVKKFNFVLALITNSRFAMNVSKEK